MADDCLFCRIAAGEIPATVVHETDKTLAFRDIAPKARVHVLVIPRPTTPMSASFHVSADPELAGQVLAAAAAVAAQEGIG